MGLLGYISDCAQAAPVRATLTRNRGQAFGWRSQPADQRVTAPIAEIAFPAREFVAQALETPRLSGFASF